MWFLRAHRLLLSPVSISTRLSHRTTLVLPLRPRRHTTRRILRGSSWNVTLACGVAQDARDSGKVEVQSDQVEEKDPLHDPSLSIFQRFHKTFKQYGIVMAWVHCFTSAIWFGTFYYAAAKGVSIVPILQEVRVPTWMVDYLRESQGGNVVSAYVLYKIMTPARYVVTLGGTSLSVKALRHYGYLKTPPSPKVKEFLQEKMDETREKISERMQGTREKLSDKVQDTREKLSDKVQDTREKLSDKVQDTREKLSDKVQDTREKLSDKVQDAREKISGKMQDTKSCVPLRRKD
uniref:Family with sequence similarity 210 member Ab n=1 Tax=Eptatretus burgeri TaxID=7764 RepID=A0A8C4QQD7_EPTBU